MLSKTQANDACDVYIDPKVPSPAPSTSHFHSDVYKGPSEWQIDPPKSDTNCCNPLVFGCDTPTEYVDQLDGSADDNKAPHGGKRTDSQESNYCHNNKEPVQHDCDIDTSSKEEECSNPEDKDQLTTVNRGRDTRLQSVAHIQGNEQSKKSVQSLIDSDMCLTLKVLHGTCSTNSEDHPECNREMWTHVHCVPVGPLLRIAFWVILGVFTMLSFHFSF